MCTRKGGKGATTPACTEEAISSMEDKAAIRHSSMELVDLSIITVKYILNPQSKQKLELLLKNCEIS
jgi:peroxiredoxin